MVVIGFAVQAFPKPILQLGSAIYHAAARRQCEDASDPVVILNKGEFIEL
jgi:hypothetical protein